jgi:hypothetical protein
MKANARDLTANGSQNNAPQRVSSRPFLWAAKRKLPVPGIRVGDDCARFKSLGARYQSVPARESGRFGLG